MTKRAFVIGARLSLGTATLLAIIWQALVLAQAGSFNLFNYFGYFTNLSNIVAAIILLVSAAYFAKSRRPSRTDDLIRGAAALYMAITGIVYVVLLTGEDLGLLLPWVNILLHIIMPLAVAADWLFRPPRSKINLSGAVLWLIFPLAFLVHTLVRGSVTGWYPYPFLNPAEVGGYGVVAAYCLGILAAFCVVGWMVMKVGNTLRREIS